MNKVILDGRIAKGPELSMTSGQVPVCKFTVACDKDYEVDGVTAADYIPCVAWSMLAGRVNGKFKKGDPIAVEGKIRIRSWTDNNGNKRYMTEVVADKIERPCERDEEYNEFSATYIGEDLML